MSTLTDNNEGIIKKYTILNWVAKEDRYILLAVRFNYFPANHCL
jgi:hypothetical protein